MTLISREAKEAPNVSTTVGTEQGQTALTGGTKGGPLGLHLLGTRRPGEVMFVCRTINHISWRWVKSGAMKVRQMEEAASCEKNKGSTQLVAFLLSRGSRAIVTSRRRSWIATVVTFKPSIGSFWKAELNVSVSLRKRKKEKKRLILLDLPMAVTHPLWIFQPRCCADDGR